MKRTRDILTIVAIAGAAFIAGRLGLPIVSSSAAIAQDHQGMEMTPEMKAWMEAASPNEHHKNLENLIGNFEAAGSFKATADGEPVKFTGTVDREWIMDGRFIKETVLGESAMGSYKAIAFIGYNNIDGQYESVHMSSDSTSIMSSTGMYHPDTKKLFMGGKYRDPITKKVVTHWSKTNISDSSRQTVTGWQVGADGKEFKSFEGVFERK